MVDQKQTPKVPWWTALPRACVSVVGVLLIIGVAPALLWFRQDEGAALTMAALGIAAFLLVRIDEVAELSLGPLKARMKETIAQANATIDQLRTVTLQLSRATLAALISTGLNDNMMGSDFANNSMTLEQRLASQDRVISSLEEIGATKDQIADATQHWRRGIGIIYHRILARAIRDAMLAASAAQPAQPNKPIIPFQPLLNYPNWQGASPKEMEEFCRQHAVLTPNIQQWIEDYRYFLDTGTIRRRNEFATS